MADKWHVYKDGRGQWVAHNNGTYSVSFETWDLAIAYVGLMILLHHHL